MSGGDPVLPGYTFEGHGPAQRRLLEWLQPQVDVPVESAVAQRSPAGPWAIKLHAPNRVPSCAELLQAEPWVDRIAVRPQHVYVRIGVDQLCAWVAEGFAPGAPDPIGGTEGRGRSVLVRAVDVDALAAAGVPRPLRLFRETAVARSVAALLRSRGFQVRLELLPPGRETYDEVWAAAPGSVTHTVVVGSGVPLPSEVERGDHVVHLPVGEVDVRHGPLRARNGGSVSADDVVAEAERSLSPELRVAASGAADEGVGGAFGEAVLALLLIATPRARRIQLDERVVLREARTLACVVEVPPGSRGGAADGVGRPHEAGELPSDADAAGREAMRDLAAELDLVATNAGRGAAGLEPALIARSLRAIAERCQALELAGSAPPDDPAWGAAHAAIESALGIAGIPAVGRHVAPVAH